MLGLLNPKTQKATAFYALLGVLCGDIWHRGLHKWNLIALVLFTGLGTLAGLAEVVHGKAEPEPVPDVEAVHHPEDRAS